MISRKIGLLLTVLWGFGSPWLAIASDTLLVNPSNTRCGEPSVSVFCSIQGVIDMAPLGATIHIDAGEYDLWGEALIVEKSLTLQGAGPIKTILDGGGDSPEPLITIAESAETVVIQGMSLVNRIRSGSRDMGPGAIDHIGGNLTVSNVVMRDNQGGWGGAVRIRSEFGEFSFDQVTIENNSSFAGAAIAVYDGPGARLEIKNSKFSNNSAVFSGGAMFFRDLSEIELNNLELTKNRSGNTGGAIHVFTQTTSTEMNIFDSKITENISGSTGGISVMGDEVQVTLERTILSGNTSEDDPVESDCSADREGMFVSKGNNRIGIGDGCLFDTSESDIVGTMN